MWQRQVSRGGVYSLVISADGATIYAGDGGGWVSAWDRAAGEQQKLFQLKGRHASDIWRLAVTTDGKRFLAATPNSFAVWDAETREFWPSSPSLASNFIFALAPDDRTVAAVMSRDHRTITFSDLDGRGPHPGHPSVSVADLVSDLVFSPAGELLAVADMAGGLHLVEPGTNQSARINGDDPDQLIAYADWCRYLAFSADGRTLAASSGRSILIWDLPERRLVRRIKAGRAIVRQLAFHPHGKLLASGGDTSVVSLWDVTTGEEVKRFDWGIGGKILSLAFAPDGMTAAAGGSSRKFVVWDLDDS
jgi:WD40 repeat protein